MSEEDVDAIRGVFAAMGEGDIEGALEFVHPDAQWVNPDYAMEPGTREGLSGVRTALTAFQDSFADLSFDIAEINDLGGRVVISGTFSGVGRASGAAIGPQAFGSLVNLANGKILRYEWFFDADEARKAAERPV